MDNKGLSKLKLQYNEALPIGGEADVVVVGSGPAGIAASIAASRHGAKVILIERYSFLGGMSTLIPISTWPLNTAVETGELDMPYDGILNEILKSLQSRNAIELHTTLMDGVESLSPENEEKLDSTKWYLFDPQELKYLYFEMIRNAKVKLKINTLLVDSIIKDNKVEAIVVETLTRRELIKGRIFIDCTGSADLVYRSGGEAILGSGENDGIAPGLIMPTSTTFRIAGVDTENLDMYKVAQVYEEHRKKGEIKVPLEGLYWQIVCKGVVQIFGTRVFNINPLDPQKAARGEMKQRHQIRDIANFLQKEIPEFHNCKIIDTGMSIGMIGTRRIRGEYFITQDDILNAKKFEDAIATGTYRLEIWEPNGENARFQHLIGTWYTIPYRSLLPKDLKNVIVAGSSISGQYVAMATWAIMPVCYKTGQAAGTAASICVKQAINLRSISISQLQATLKEDGMFLG
jgi:hypothetical protein